MTAPLLGLDSPELTLEAAGGKAVNLGRLIRAGFPTPPGQVLVTSAYRDVVRRHNLAAVIHAELDRLGRLGEAGPADLERASSRIRDAFLAVPVPPDLVAALLAAWRELGSGPLAVRSSATVEDLPTLSFAGQQDSFLNVTSEPALTAAVAGCWSSLWTARAIGYRQRNGIDHAAAALAVVLQQMRLAQVAGVMFTANPLTGRRDQTVIDATYGLGESLVSGQVEPDHVVADSATGAVLERRQGAKAMLSAPREGGGVDLMPAAGGGFCLTDGQIRELVALGGRVQAEFGAPQDIEWVLVEGQLAVVQSRAVTSLYPLPAAGAGGVDHRGAVWLSFGAVQGMLDPITPLGRDALRLIFVGGAAAFGYDVGHRDVAYLDEAGERLWVRVDAALRHPVGRRIAPAALAMVEPSAGRVVADLLADPAFRGRRRPSPLALWRLARFVVPLLGRVAATLARPEWARRRLDSDIADLVAAAHRREAAAAAAADPQERLRRRVEAMRLTLTSGFPTILPRFAPIMAPSMVLLRRLSAAQARLDSAGGRLRPSADASAHGARHGVAPAVLELTRSVPGNVTTAMDLALWQVAQAVRADPLARAAVADGDPAQVAADFAAGALPAAAQESLASFLSRYGMRGVAEIDLGRPRWREDPSALIRTLRSYVGITDPAQAPDEVFRRGRRAAERAVEAVGTSRRARFMARRVRQLLGARESPKFAMVQLLGVVRQGLLESGRDLVGLGLLRDAEEVFYLEVDELAGLAEADPRQVAALVAARRAAAAAERRRGATPRVLLGDGRAFYEGAGADQDRPGVLAGSPVSPGVSEGVVRVVFDPHLTPLAPGEILVCPGTDPAWTPLFLAAAGLVTEVGGMMTHGSVVAREYASRPWSACGRRRPGCGPASGCAWTGPAGWSNCSTSTSHPPRSTMRSNP